MTESKYVYIDMFRGTQQEQTVHKIEIKGERECVCREKEKANKRKITK